MLQIYNYTPFQTERGILLDKNGVQVWVVAIKATYAFDDAGKVKLAEEQEAVCLAPEHFGEPGKSSLRREGELVVEHPGTDIAVNAAAYAPGNRPAASVNVAVDVAGLRKALTVFGDRVWTVSGLGAYKTTPRPFGRMPIVYERAFGGLLGEGATSAGEPRNPVGVGFALDKAQLHQQPLPNVEELTGHIESWKDRPAPAGLGVIASDWSPRREFAGTFDESWKRTRAPFWPSDHNPLFHRSAPAGLWSQQPLRGGERVAMVGLTPSGRLEFRIPHEAFLVETRLGGRRFTQPPPQLDRVIIDVDERRLVQVWVARLACGARARQVEFTSVDLKKRLS
jgi:hypothetical protein